MHEAELLATIRANPDDDVPRTLYADALLDQGNERGQYIQLSLAGGYQPWLQENATRIEHAWQAELGCRGSNPFLTFKRGLPFQIGGSVENIAKARDVIARYPITDLHCWGMTAFTPLAALEELSFIRKLSVDDLDKKPIATSVIEQVIAAPHLAPTQLETAETLTDDSARAWATAPWLGTLELFATLNAPVTGVGIAALAQRGMPALKELRTFAVALGDHGAEALAASPLDKLETLHCAKCQIGETGGRALFGSSAMTRAISISAPDNEIGAGVRGLVRAPHVRDLDLSGNALAGHAAALAHADLPALVKLVLTGNVLTVEVAAAFATTTGLRLLEHLDLKGNALGLAGVAPFETLAGLPALRLLGLRENDLASGKTETFEGGDEWNPWSRTVDIELTAGEIAERLKLRTGVTVF